MYYTDKTHQQMIKLLHVPRKINAKLFCEQQKNIILDAYHGMEPILNFDNWNNITRPLIIDIFININKNSYDNEDNEDNEDNDDNNIITIDKRSVTNISKFGLCKLESNEVECLYDQDRNLFVCELSNNKVKIIPTQKLS